MRNCIVAQSGGPTVAINASLSGVIAKAEDSFDHIYGSLHGIAGIFHDEIIDLGKMKREIPDFLKRLSVTPAMYLGSCRYKLPDEEEHPDVYEQIFSYFREKEIVSFFYIGGNDSMDTVLKLDRYAKKHHIDDVTILGVPKTIDNDLCLTDHTPGYGSAAKYIATTMKEIAYDTSIYPVKSVTIVEIMGRDAGWLTAAAALSRTSYGLGPDFIYLPEVPFSTTDFLSDVTNLLSHKKNILIAISEGIRDRNGNYISATDSTVDSFGHSQLSGAGKTLEYLVAEKIGVKVRSIELNLPQRCGAHLASKTDLSEAYKLGETAVVAANEKRSGEMAVLCRTSDAPYAVSYDMAPIDEIANQVKAVPRDWICKDGNDVTEQMIAYLAPLIVGEPEIAYKDGMPEYLDLTHLYRLLM